MLSRISYSTGLESASFPHYHKNQLLRPSLLSSQLPALPLSTKPFRADSRSHRVPRQRRIPQAALNFNSIPQEALFAGGAGAMSCLKSLAGLGLNLWNINSQVSHLRQTSCLLRLARTLVII